MSLEVMQALFEIAGANSDLALALTPKLGERGEVREETSRESSTANAGRDQFIYQSVGRNHYYSLTIST
jgi:hypothetical protein